MSRRLISFTGSAFAAGFFLSSSLSEESSFFAAEIPENREFFICSRFSSTTGFGGSVFLLAEEVLAGVGLEKDEAAGVGSAGADEPQTYLVPPESLI